MTNGVPPSLLADEAGLLGLRGLEAFHDFDLALSDWTGWPAIAEHMQAAGANLQSLSLSRGDIGFSVRCRLKDLTSAAARDLASTLLQAGLAERVQVEHLLTRAGARP